MSSFYRESSPGAIIQYIQEGGTGVGGTAGRRLRGGRQEPDGWMFELTPPLCPPCVRLGERFYLVLSSFEVIRVEDSLLLFQFEI